MAWFKVDDKLHSSKKLLRIPRRHRMAALGLWTIAGSWSADQLTDGQVPDYMIEEWGGTKTLVDWLVKADLWVPTPDGTEFKNWGEYQPTKADIEAGREKNREKLRNWRDRNRGTNEGVTGLQDGSKPESNPAPVPSRPDPTKVNTTSSSDADASDPEAVVDPGETFSDEVRGLCDYLADRIHLNGNKVGAVGVRWHQAADRLMRLDGYTPDQIRQVIDWSQQDEFWQGNILSMSKLREKFDQLKTKMLNERQRAQQQGTGNKSMDRMRNNFQLLQGMNIPTTVDPFEQKALGQ